MVSMEASLDITKEKFKVAVANLEAAEDAAAQASGDFSKHFTRSPCGLRDSSVVHERTVARRQLAQEERRLNIAEAKLENCQLRVESALEALKNCQQQASAFMHESDRC